MGKQVDSNRVELLLKYVSALESIRGGSLINSTGSVPIHDRIHKACNAIESLLLDDVPITKE